jgi:hypothetical protein
VVGRRKLSEPLGNGLAEHKKKLLRHMIVLASIHKIESYQPVTKKVAKMKFSEHEIDELDGARVNHLVKLLSKLCGQDLDHCITKSNEHASGRGFETRTHENMLVALCRNRRWNISTLNQALLLLRHRG